MEVELTPRELEIAKLTPVLSDREIAEETGISFDTVKFHVRNLFSKYLVTKRTTLVAKLIFEGVIKESDLTFKSVALFLAFSLFAECSLLQLDSYDSRQDEPARRTRKPSQLANIKRAKSSGGRYGDFITTSNGSFTIAFG